MLLVSLNLWTFYLILLVARLFTFGSSARSIALQQWTMRRWSNGCLRIMGARVEIEGEVPEPPYFLVSNHLGHVDIFLLGLRVGARFVAKREVRGWPVIGHMCEAAGTLFIDRERRRDLLRMNELIAGAMEEGRGVLLFPEGTSSRGEELLPFKPSLLDLPAKQGWPVHYATIHYETPAGEPPAGLFVCWWGGMPFLPHFQRLCEMRGFTARLRFGPAPVEADNRKELAIRLRKAMMNQFEAV